MPSAARAGTPVRRRRSASVIAARARSSVGSGSFVRRCGLTSASVSPSGGPRIPGSSRAGVSARDAAQACAVEEVVARDAVQAGVGVAGVEDPARQVELHVASCGVVVDGDDHEVEARVRRGGDLLPARGVSHGRRSGGVEHGGEPVGLQHRCLCLGVACGEVSVQVRGVKGVGVDCVWRAGELDERESPAGRRGDTSATDERTVVEVQGVRDVGPIAPGCS